MVYKSMNDGFLDVLKNSEVVDSIVELMKQRQDSVNESNASTANVSDTTKKVALNQLSPDNVDLTSVMMDFAADL
jgi:serine/threonine protein phosphatase PrpC